MRPATRPTCQIRLIRTQSKARHASKPSKLSESYDRGAFFSRPQALSTPRQLVDHLNEYVIGQHVAKKVLSVSLFNHYNRVRQNRAASVLEEHDEETYVSELELENESVASARLHPHPIRREIPRSNLPPDPLFEKSNVLVMGPSGSGKTLLVRTLAKVLDVPFSVTDATALTQAGYVGDDADICIQRLLQAANYDPKLAARGIVYIDEIDKLARRDGSGSGEGGSRDVSGEGVQQALLRIIEGTIVTVSGKGNGASEGTVETRARSPPNNQYEIDTSNVLFIFSGAFVGLENIINRRVAKGSIGFTATLKGEKHEPEPKFNKYFTPKDVPYNVYDLVEPEDLVQYGFIPEFVARMPSMTSLSPLSQSDLRQILTSVRGSLIGQYTAQFLLMGVDIKFTTSAIDAICSKAFARGGGARGLRGIMEKLLLEPMYECPGSNIKYVLITEGVVKGTQPVGYWAKGLLREFIDAWAAEERTQTPAEPPITKPKLRTATSRILGTTHDRTDTTAFKI